MAVWIISYDELTVDFDHCTMNGNQWLKIAQ